MKQLEKKFEEIEKLIEFGNYEEALSIIKKWEKEKPISNIKAMEIKILKSLYYNTISKYDMALAIADQLLKESRKEKNIYYEFYGIILKIKSLESLNKMEESFLLIKQGDIIANKFYNNENKKNQLISAKYFLTKGAIYQKSYQYEESLKFHNKGLKIFENINNLLGISNALCNIGLVYSLTNQFQKAITNFDNSLEISTKFELNMTTAWIYLHKAMALFQSGSEIGIKEAIDNSMKISTKFKNIHAEDYASTIMAMYYYRDGDFVKALKQQKNSYKLRKIRGNKLEMAYSLCMIAQIYSKQGKLEKAYNFMHKLFLISEDMDDLLAVPLFHSIYGEILAERGNFCESSKHLFTAIDLFEKTNEFYQRLRCYHFLIWMMIIQQKKKEAFGVLEKLKELSIKFQDNQQIQLAYKLEKGIYLKYSRNTYNEELAKQIFESLNNEDNIFAEITIEAIIHNIEIHISEFKISPKREFLESIQRMTIKLLKIAEKQKNPALICESYLLNAQLALNNQRIDQSKVYFRKAQEIAQKNELNFLAQKVSDKYDDLLNKINSEENCDNIHYRFKNLDFEFMFSKITRNFGYNFPNFTHTPIFIIIWIKKDANANNMIFYLNEEDFPIENTKMNVQSFIRSKYSKFLEDKSYDRIKIDDYMIIKKKNKTIQIDYGFQGSSFIAEKKIDTLINKIKKIKDTWIKIFLNSDKKDIKFEIQNCVNDVFSKNH